MQASRGSDSTIKSKLQKRTLENTEFPRVFVNFDILFELSLGELFSG